MSLKSKYEDIFKPATEKDLAKRSENVEARIDSFWVGPSGHSGHIEMDDFVDHWIWYPHNKKIAFERFYDEPTYLALCRYIAKRTGLDVKLMDEEKAVINTAMAGLNEKDVFSPAEPEDIKKRFEEFGGKFREGDTVRLKRDVGFYDYETGGGHTAKEGSVGKIYHIWGPPTQLQRRQGGSFPIEATVDFPDGSAGIFGFDDLEIINEDIFKPAKRGEVKKRKRTFDKSAEGAREQFNKIRSDFSAMMHEFTRNDEDPPEYLTELGKEMRWLSKEIVPEDPESALDVLNRAKELLRQLRIFVTGEDVSEDIFRPASGEEVKKREEEHAEKVGYAPFRRIVSELDRVLDKKAFSADDNLTWLNIFDTRSNNVIVSVELFEDETDEGASVIKVENHWELGQDAHYDVGYEKNIEKNVVDRTMKTLKDYLEDKNAGTGNMPNR